MSCTGLYPELVAGRALDALEPGDDALLDAHLPTCPDCRALLDVLLGTAAELAHGVDDVEPPPELLDRIRAALPADDRRRPLPEPVSLDERRRRRRPAHLAGRVAAGLVAAAVVATGTYAVHVRSERDHAEGSLSASDSVIHHLQDPGAYSVSLRSGGAATGTAVVDGRTVDLVAQNLGRNDPRSGIYVLWAGSATHPTMVAVATFDVTSGDKTVVQATLPSSMAAPTAFGVTHEKGRTAPARPGTPVLGSTNGA